jgi:DNA-binding beta-propeller fold protein YncE
MLVTKVWPELSVPAPAHVRSLALAIALTLLLVTFTLQGCGSSAGSGTTPPANSPPPPDFTFNIDGTTLTTQQQGNPQTFGVAPEGQFSGAVLVTIGNLPAGVSAYPPGPFNLASGVGATVTLFASAATPIGNYTVTIDGTLAQTAHSAKINLIVGPGAPFHLTLSQSSLSMTPATQGNLTATVSVSAAPVPTQILFSYSQLPANSGVEWTQSPFPIVTATSWSQPIAVTATVFAQSLQSFPWIITATSGANSSSAVLPISVSNPFPTITKPTRSTFVRTDEDVTGAVYDRSRRLVFTTVDALNEVLVFSSADASLRATIPVDRPWSIDEAADASRVYVGSWNAEVTVIDPDSLEVVQVATAPANASAGVLSGDHYSLQNLAALSNGKVLIAGSVDVVGGNLFFLLDPGSNSITPLNVPGFNPVGLGSMYRTGDHSKALLTGTLTSGGMTGAVWYDAGTGNLTPIAGYPSAGISSIALNQDGSQIAGYDGQQDLTIFDSNFNSLDTIALQGKTNTAEPLIYSLDGKFLYAVMRASNSGVVAILDAKSFGVIGMVPDLSIGPVEPTIAFTIDETGMIFGGQQQSRGLIFLDASSPGAIGLPFFSVGYPFLTPNLLSLSKSEQTSITDTGLGSSAQYQVFFGAPPTSPQTLIGTNVAVNSQGGITATSPPGRTTGVANATVTRPDGWYQVAPDIASYGPQILSINANVGPAEGNSNLIVYGYGFDLQSTQLTIGGSAASIAHIYGPGLMSPFPFPMEIMEATTPPGRPGFADVTVTTSFGSTTVSHGFEYLSQSTVYVLPGALNQIVYDSGRQRLYVSNSDHNRIEVFSLTSNSFLPPIPTGTFPIGIALSPDGSKLAAANNGDGTVSVIDPNQMKAIGTYPVLSSVDSGCQPLALTAIQSQRVVVNTVCPSPEFQGNVHILDLNTGSLSCVGVTGCLPDGVTLRPGLPQIGPQTYIAFASSRDGSKLVFHSFSDGLIGILDVNANTVTSSLAQGGNFPTMDADGGLFGVRKDASPDLGLPYPVVFDSQVREVRLMNDIDYLAAGPYDGRTFLKGALLNPSGSLFYLPEQTSFSSIPITSGVDIFDVHRGRLATRLALPDPVVSAFVPMTLDDTGERIFLISSKGIMIAQLVHVPLSISSANPSRGTAGTLITIRGSGFASGASVTFGTVTSNANFVDPNTLQVTLPAVRPGSVRVTVSNLDGTQYSYDDLFQAQ